MTDRQSTANTSPEPPRGWFITCPVCRQDWKVRRDDLTDETWQMCPTCLDSRCAEEREGTK